MYLLYVSVLLPPTTNQQFTAQNNRAAAVPYENVYADRFFSGSGAVPMPAGKDNGLLQGPLAEYRGMQRPLARNFSSLQTQLVGHVSINIYIHNVYEYLFD